MVKELEPSGMGIVVDKSKATSHYGSKPINFQEGRDKIYSKSYSNRSRKERRQYSDIDIRTFPRSGRRSIDRKV